jgi:hypothetical protein
MLLLRREAGLAWWWRRMGDEVALEDPTRRPAALTGRADDAQRCGRQRRRESGAGGQVAGQAHRRSRHRS